MKRESQITGTMLELFLKYDPETGLFTSNVSSSPQRGVGDVAGGRHQNGYTMIQVCGIIVRAHRLAWLWMTGEWPSEVDHINGNRSDNRWSNLRIVTRPQNIWNSGLRSDNTSGCKGVQYDASRGKWMATITHNKKTVRLGRFHNLLDAVEVRKRAETKYHGEFATNRTESFSRAHQK